MQSALFNARKNRLARIAALDAPSGPALVASFHNIFSKGKRLATALDSTGNGMVLSPTAVSMTQEFAAFSQAFNRQYGDGPDYGSGTLTAGTSGFTWQFSEAVALAGIAMSGGDNNTDLGMWDVQGSNDGVTWLTITATPFHWKQVSTGWIDGASAGFNTLFTNVLAFTHYQLIYRSGSFNGGRLCNEIWFKVMGHPLVDSQSSFVLTSGGTGMAVFNRPISDLVDGLYNQDYPNNAPDQVRFTGPHVGDFLAFDFGAGNSVSVKRFLLDTDGQFGDNGSWKWQVSADGGVSYKDSGTAFEWNSLSIAADLVFPGGNSADKSRFWRLVCVATGPGNMNGMYEIVFDFYDE